MHFQVITCISFPVPVLCAAGRRGGGGGGGGEGEGGAGAVERRAHGAEGEEKQIHHWPSQTQVSRQGEDTYSRVLGCATCVCVCVCECV